MTQIILQTSKTFALTQFLINHKTLPQKLWGKKKNERGKGWLTKAIQSVQLRFLITDHFSWKPYEGTIGLCWISQEGEVPERSQSPLTPHFLGLQDQEICTVPILVQANISDNIRGFVCRECIKRKGLCLATWCWGHIQPGEGVNCNLTTVKDNLPLLPSSSGIQLSVNIVPSRHCATGEGICLTIGPAILCFSLGPAFKWKYSDVCMAESRVCTQEVWYFEEMIAASI